MKKLAASFLGLLFCIGGCEGPGRTSEPALIELSESAELQAFVLPLPPDADGRIDVTIPEDGFLRREDWGYLLFIRLMSADVEDHSCQFVSSGPGTYMKQGAPIRVYNDSISTIHALIADGHVDDSVYTVSVESVINAVGMDHINQLISTHIWNHPRDDDVYITNGKSVSAVCDRTHRCALQIALSEDLALFARLVMTAPGSGREISDVDRLTCIAGAYRHVLQYVRNEHAQAEPA